jgi:hypothetical protein
MELKVHTFWPSVPENRSKSNTNHIKDFYGSLNPFDAYDLIRELLSPLNDKL